MANVPPDVADRARALFGDIIEGRWEQARGGFRGHLDADRIAHARAHAASPAGASTTWASRLPARSASTLWWNFR